jgi:hypothetical protein
MKYGVEVHYQLVENGKLVLVNKRRFLAHVSRERDARVFAQSWADSEGFRVISINVFQVGVFPY